jgi:Tol biopolymer transport system component
MDADGSDIQQVTSGVLRIGGRSDWSPDGNQLVFYAGRKGDRDIYIVDIPSGVITRLTYGGNNTGPCFSTDGAWITFSSSRDGDHEIYRMRTDGSELTQLTYNEAVDDWQPRWGP